MIVSPEQILAGIRDEAPDRPGGFGRRSAKPVVQRRSPAVPGELTVLERSAICRIADGWSNAAIAFERGVSEDTVKSQVRALFKKLGAGSRAQAVHHAHQRGLLT